jgi:Na(+)-translocating NADH:ubiquinone oxidoreductase A subunit
MKLRGGYNVCIAGRPSGEIETLPTPNVLHIPLQSRRFHFTELLVEEGAEVKIGQALATDPANHSLPLVGPASGTVRLSAVEGHLTIENTKAEPDAGGVGAPDGPKRDRLLALGAWRFASDVHTGGLPDPQGAPRAIIISTERQEPYVASAATLLAGRVADFLRGLKSLVALSGTKRVLVAIPKGLSGALAELRDALASNKYCEVVPIPSRYPLGDPRVIARSAGLKKQPGSPVWAFDVAGILAIDDALNASRPSIHNVISVAGPGTSAPRHVKALVGHPLEGIIGDDVARAPCRVINGGAMSGTAVPPEEIGLSVECSGLTLIPEHTEREMLGFMRPGFFRISYSDCFLSSLMPTFYERLTTGVRGERRPCVSCGFCEDVCPAGIMPHLIHKYLYADDIDGAERMRIDLCIECGLCSYVCPAKLELRQQFVEAKEQMRLEMQADEVTT